MRCNIAVIDQNPYCKNGEKKLIYMYMNDKHFGNCMSDLYIDELFGPYVTKSIRSVITDKYTRKWKYITHIEHT